ncbi:pseudouridine synthase [Pseudohongiella spirulinae]|uniref:Pseudouridine synthase n=1 Tax=Pseudohongiella spirulinae TaxID=1249552 RepID=A0A0S2KH14_9GAMM|nr:pseudouridine synthase [Pseudohongiella spirulinae]ALO47632.1 Pseudouridine synthase [Pseudohongiella spirulinae]
MTTSRLDKYVSQCTGLTRSDAKKIIRQKRISVNGKVCQKADHAVDKATLVELDAMPLVMPSQRYYMLNKPSGYLCANTDSQAPVVMDLLTENTDKLSVAGRLDKDTTGLVLISDDGAWVHAVISPRRQCTKVYQAILDSPVDNNIIEQFKNGIQLKNETKLTLPAQLSVIDGTHVNIELQEGRYHQIKRMFAACGRHVVSLHRSRIGDIELDKNLKPGEYRELTSQEINGIKL